MNDTATKDDLKQLGLDIDQKINKAVTELSEIIGTLAQSMHNELEVVKDEQRDTRIALDRLTNTIDGFVGRIDHYETEQMARDRQFERLLAWAHKVSKKTGIPLENL